MIEVKGKYAEAKIFTDLFDDMTVSQIIGILNSPVTENQKVRILNKYVINEKINYKQKISEAKK